MLLESFLTKLKHLNGLKAWLFGVKNIDKEFFELAIGFKGAIDSIVKSLIMVI